MLYLISSTHCCLQFYGQGPETIIKEPKPVITMSHYFQSIFYMHRILHTTVFAKLNKMFNIYIFNIYLFIYLTTLLSSYISVRNVAMEENQTETPLDIPIRDLIQTKPGAYITGLHCALCLTIRDKQPIVNITALVFSKHYFRN